MTDGELRVYVRKRVDDIRNDPQVVRSELWDRITDEVIRIVEEHCRCEGCGGGCSCRRKE